MALTKKQRAELREMFGGKCAYCGCDLPEKGWHADHKEAIYRTSVVDEEAKKKGIWKLVNDGGCERPELDTVGNYFPSCAPCNLFKSTFSIEMFRKELERQIERARKSSVNFRNCERYGLIEITNKPVIFWFERYKNA